jgi:hypothetical protein
MPDQFSTKPNKKPLYEAPHAVRLDDSNRAHGFCPDGNSDSGDCQPGGTAGTRCFPGIATDGECYQNGFYAGGGCTSPGNTLGG